MANPYHEILLNLKVWNLIRDATEGQEEGIAGCVSKWLHISYHTSMQLIHGFPRGCSLRYGSILCGIVGGREDSGRF